LSICSLTVDPLKQLRKPKGEKVFGLFAAVAAEALQLAFWPK
jgi:hypothetical protein